MVRREVSGRGTYKTLILRKINIPNGKRQKYFWISYKLLKRRSDKALGKKVQDPHRRLQINREQETGSGSQSWYHNVGSQQKEYVLMQFKFSFRHMEASQALQNYSKDKVSIIVKKFVTKPIEANITFSVSSHKHKVQCTLAGGDGFSLQVEHACEDMYGSVDRMVDKLTAQLKKKKDRLKGHKGHRRLSHGNYADPQLNDLDHVEVDAEDIVAYERAMGRLKVS